jgi:hypothetical protein
MIKKVIWYPVIWEMIPWMVQSYNARLSGT